MVGRGAEGRPWFPGALGRFLATGRREPAPSLARQGALAAALYRDMLDHHGSEIGGRHARKHLGWALDVAGQSTGVPAEFVKQARAQVLTATHPATVLQRLAEAYDGFSLRLAA
jgi:tRNA-dihydrouridine synthase